MSVETRIAAGLGQQPTSLQSLAGGCVGEVYGVTLTDGERVVAKVDQSQGGNLDLEGWMLDYLRPHLPVPEVLHADPGLLLMQWMPGSSSFDGAAERHAAELLAQLHAVQAPEAGLERPTLIGGLHQPNRQTSSWVTFFGQQRLLYMAGQAHQHSRLDARTLGRVEALVGRLDEWLGEPPAMSLLHGDIWSGNVLAQRGRITGFLDPAIYYGDPEIELAFIAMFSTFGDAFYDAYRSLRGMEPEFMTTRRHLYNLYPYLVHVRLFGGSYLQGVRGILDRFGC